MKTIPLGDVLTAYRAVHGIEARDLARDIGIHPATLSRIESGQRGPDAATLVRIVAWLTGVSTFPA